MSLIRSVLAVVVVGWWRLGGLLHVLVGAAVADGIELVRAPTWRLFFPKVGVRARSLRSLSSPRDFFQSLAVTVGRGATRYPGTREQN